MNVVELFPCSGGMAEGARRAGVTISMAFDWSVDACASYEANHGHRPIQIDVMDLLRMVRAGWRPPPIDLLIADPPCTPWSRAGKRLGTADERDMLGTTIALIELLRPRAYLLANVPGLDDAPNWPVVQETIGGLARVGYCVVDFARLDAADYGVPQHRVRPFWFGHLDGPCVVWPSRTHGAIAECSPTLPGIERLRPYVTCRQALEHLSAEDLGSPIKLRWRGCSSAQHGSVADGDGNVVYQAGLRRRANHAPSRADAPARTLTRNTHSDGALVVVPHHPISPDRDGLSRTIRASAAGTPDKVLAWPWDRPATTVTTRDVVPPPGHHPEEGSILSQPGAIKLSERAAAILQGFPEAWRFVGATKRARWEQIGMAMPSALAEAVFRAILRARAAVRRSA